MTGVTGGAAGAEFITALISVAAYYETHPGAAVPRSPVLSVPVPDGTDEDKEAFVDAFAAGSGVEARWEYAGHYIARRDFGPITLEAHFWPCAAKRRHLARHSYDDSVRVHEAVAARTVAA